MRHSWPLKRFGKITLRNSKAHHPFMIGSIHTPCVGGMNLSTAKSINDKPIPDILLRAWQAVSFASWVLSSPLLSFLLLPSLPPSPLLYITSLLFSFFLFHFWLRSSCVSLAWAELRVCGRLVWNSQESCCLSLLSAGIAGIFTIPCTVNFLTTRWWNQVWWCGL